MKPGNIISMAVVAVCLGFPQESLAGDADMVSEIEATSDALQKATENLGCLVTLSGSNETELVKILDMLTDGERKLRDARRLAQNASTAEDQMLAIEHARSSRAIIDLAEGYREQSGIN